MLQQGCGPSQTGKTLQLRDPNATIPPGPPADTPGAETCVGVGWGTGAAVILGGLCLLAVGSPVRNGGRGREDWIGEEVLELGEVL